MKGLRGSVLPAFPPEITHREVAAQTRRRQRPEMKATIGAE